MKSLYFIVEVFKSKICDSLVMSSLAVMCELTYLMLGL